MVTLDSRKARFGLGSKFGENAIEFLKSTAGAFADMTQDKPGFEIEIEVRLVSSSPALRAGKTLMRDMLVGYIETLGNKRAVWACEATHTIFDFARASYVHRDKDIYLTEGEQLFLYRALVLKEHIGRDEKVFARTLRTKFGKDFLVGYI